MKLSNILCYLAIISIGVSAELGLKGDKEWLSWKKQHLRSYESDIHELEKYVTWKSNKAYIDAHNELKDEFGYYLSLNQFGDLSSSQYYYSTECLLESSYGTKKENFTINGRKVKKLKFNNFKWPKGLNTSSLPSEVDWRTMGAVSDIKDQGRCLSCYAFAVTGALEGMNSLAYGKLITLSEQNIIDCSGIYGNQGCSGGSRIVSMTYIVDNNGISTDTSYPYIGYQGMCQSDSYGIEARATGMVKIPTGSEEDLMGAVAIAGPVTVGVDHLHSSFQFYGGGVFNEPSCSYSKLSHAMLIIGYGTYNGKDYWLLKNSWGTTWGNSGYIMMVRGKYNQCGIATSAIYPTV